MASSGDQSLRDALECPVCKDLFTEPKQLDCGHTYCLNCVNGLEKVPNIVHRISVQNNVQCPQCRKMCLVPDSGLSTNYTIKDMVDKFRETVQFVDDGAPSFLRLGAAKMVKKEQQRHCHACAKKVPDSELFICKDCNKPTKKQFICALCVVRSHKQHTVVTLDCLASERDRELAALRIEEILNHAQRMVDESRGMQSDIAKQFETMRENLLAKLSFFYALQNECLNGEQILLKEHIEEKVYSAIHKCEQLNEHFLRLRELKSEFEQHLKRWHSELVAEDASSSMVSSCTALLQPMAHQTHRFHGHFGGSSSSGMPTVGQITAPNSSTRKCHFAFLGSPTDAASAGDRAGNSSAELMAVAEQMAVGNTGGSSSSKRAPPILVRRRSRLRGGGFGAGGPSAGISASSILSAGRTPSAGDDGMDSGGEPKRQPDLFSFFDQ
ncbi:hypothetical protein niasHS_006470 [Heterodera schachtii]|uniref:RING-type domain-containing protein n=1 Tax=Heterodera schachtii TaxID=97005 RepID=A0ABD2JHC4_HETSC